MSSVPVQLLIHVMDVPTCRLAPVFLHVNRCLEAVVNAWTTFNITIINRCDPDIADIDGVIMSSSVPGMNISEEITSPINDSIVYVTFRWRPAVNQVGSQKLCLIAFTE